MGIPMAERRPSITRRCHLHTERSNSFTRVETTLEVLYSKAFRGLGMLSS